MRISFDSILVLAAVVFCIGGCSYNNGFPLGRADGPPGSFQFQAIPMNGSIVLRWTPSQYAASYVVQMGTAPNFFQTTLSNNGASPMTVTGLANGTDYYFNIGALNALGAVYGTAEAAPAAVLRWNYRHQPGFTANAVTGLSTAVDSNGTAYVAFQDITTGKLSVMTESGGAWTPVGTAGFATGSDATLVLDSTGAPVLCFKDSGNLLQVMKYGSGGWANVGSAGFATNGAGGLSCALDSNDVPYVAFQDAANSDELSVFTYTNGAWSALGAPGISPAAANSISIAVNSNNVPYIAYLDANSANQASVIEYFNNQWSSVGAAHITANPAADLALRMDSTDKVYLAYQDNGLGASVQVFSGGIWSQLGAAEFTPGNVNSVAMAVTPSGTPYVVFSDASQGGKLTAMNFSGGLWSAVGPAGFSEAEVESEAIAIDSTGIITVAAVDFQQNNKLSVFGSSYTQPANTLGWTTTYPATATALAASWTLSSDFTLVSQQFQAYSDEFCNTPAGGVISIASPSTNTHGLTGTAGLHTSYRIMSQFNSQDSIWSTCSGVMGVTSLFSYPGGAMNPLSATGTVPAIAVDATNTTWVAYRDSSTGTLSVMTYNAGGTGTWATMPNVSGINKVSAVAIYIDPTNGPYVAYADGGQGGQVTVQNYSAGNWSVVGAAGFSQHSAARISVMTDAAGGNPHVIFVDQTTQNPVVMKFSAGNWAPVGSFAATTNFAPSLAFDTTPTAYAAYLDAGNSNAVTVNKFGGGIWNVVGAALSPASAVSMGLDALNQPTVAFIDGSNANKLTVMNYVSNNWTVIGTAGFGTAAANSVQLLIGGGPFVVYQDAATDDAVVMKFNTGTWSNMGSLSYAGWGVGAFSAVLDPSQHPWIAYQAGNFGPFISVRQYVP